MKALIVLIVLSLVACSTKTTITKIDDSDYIITSKSDALVILKPDGSVIVDNRGRVSAAEMLFSSLFTDTAKTVEIDVDELKNVED